MLGLALDLLYSGRIGEAWEDLYHYYRYPDVAWFRAGILARFSSSQLSLLPPE